MMNDPEAKREMEQMQQNMTVQNQVHIYVTSFSSISYYRKPEGSSVLQFELLHRVSSTERSIHHT